MARKYFSEENTFGLDKSDIAILNRAARYFADVRKIDPPIFAVLSAIRTSYERGMSAQDLIEKVEDAS